MVSDVFIGVATVITENDVRRTPEGGMDPELNPSHVGPGQLRGVELDGGDVTVKVALTIAGCPLRTQLRDEIESKLRGLPGVARINIEMGSMDQDERSELMSKARWKARETAAPTEVPASCRVIAV